MSINQVGEKFNLQKLIQAQDLTKKIVRDVASKAFVGMSELDGHDLLNSEFKKYGEIKFWHPHKFRIGRNTLCAFKDESDPSVRLLADDIFFIDVGPILYEHEGDFGETFVVGELSEGKKLQDFSSRLFDEAKKVFFENNFNGKDLYYYLNTRATHYGLNLNMKTLGHRVGDFPHHLYYRGKMADVEEKLLPNLWVLEVQISNLENTIGAFFEDILFDAKI
jgi:Xaa-Pro aminopeptidase